MDTQLDNKPHITTGSRLLPLNTPLSVAIACRDDALTVRQRLRHDHSSGFFVDGSQQNLRTRCTKRVGQFPQPHQQQPTTAVSRRNARERKRVKLVNLGFATLRDHVPSGSKTKKLSKVETLRSAISYIRQLQGILGEHGDYQDILMDDSQENYGSRPESVSLEDSSASDELMMELINQTPPPVNGSLGGSDAVISSSSPASSTEGSIVASPYGEPQLLDIGSWFT